MTKCSVSDMVELHWKDRAIVADFVMPGDESHLLRVQFAHAETLRVLDEMPLSIQEESNPDVGMVSDHFAYQVEGAAFFEREAHALRHLYPDLKHFRLITGWTCLDVLSQQDPVFSVVRQGER
jgi:hypothetical protein